MAKSKIGGDMPHNVEAEQSLLGCLLLDRDAQTELLSTLREEDFYSESHRCIFKAIETLSLNNKVIDLVTLIDELEKEGLLESAGGIAYITKLTDFMPSTANYRQYYDIVTRDGLMRRLIKGSSEIITHCISSKSKTDSMAFAEKVIYDVSDSLDTGKLVRIDSVIPEVIMTIDKVSTDKTALRGIRTKYKGLDAITDGLHKSDLIILAARPSVGKTSFAMNIVGNVALQGYSCAVFSLEMSKEQLVQRLMCSVSGVSLSHASRGEMSKEEWTKFMRANEQLSKSKIYIDDSAVITPQEVLSQCRRLKAKQGLDLVMIDYIQLMSNGINRKDDSRQREITDISRNLKILAKEINVPVIALSQLNRAVENRKGRPQLSDLRESGAIEQDADIVLFIHRPDKNADQKDIDSGKIKKNVAQIIIEKHRNGATGMVELYFDGERTKFLNIDGETGEIEDMPGERVSVVTSLPKENAEEDGEPLKPEDPDDIF